MLGHTDRSSQVIGALDHDLFGDWSAPLSERVI
jgi:hypothetical protein